VSSSVGSVSGQCRGSVGAVSVDTGVGVSSSVGAVSEQCRGLLTLDLLAWRQAVSECRSVGVSGCRGVSRSVGVSACRRVGRCRSVGWCRVGDSVKQ
jgi:hypothetical protein